MKAYIIETSVVTVRVCIYYLGKRSMFRFQEVSIGSYEISASHQKLQFLLISILGYRYNVKAWILWISFILENHAPLPTAFDRAQPPVTRCNSSLVPFTCLPLVEEKKYFKHDTPQPQFFHILFSVPNSPVILSFYGASRFLDNVLHARSDSSILGILKRKVFPNCETA